MISGDIGGSFPENLFEEDLFSWIGETEQGVDLSRRFLDVFLNFNLGQINRDIFKQLYQEMVSPGVRHDLGEYYTPDWLATYLINELKLDPEASVLDPGCGSGTFLVEAIHDKKERNSRSIPDFLDDLQREVVGIDVHPLAVAIARANYVVAVEDLLSERRSTFRIPVHLADSLSLKLRFSDELSTIDLGGAEVLDEPITIWDGEYSYSIPIKGIQSPSKFDTALDIVSDYLDDKRGFEKRFCREIPDFENIVHVFENIREEMAQAEKDGRDSIHAFILRNFSRPLQLMEHRFDAVVGNPPFLTYNSMGSDQQKNVKELLSAYNLYPGGGNVVNMDISTLFVARTSDLYLKVQGRLAFVMTRGIFSARQHEPFRRGEMSIPLSVASTLNL